MIDRMAKRFLFFTVFAVGHLLLTILATVNAVGAVVLGANDPAAAVSPTVQRFWYLISKVLLFPLGLLAPSELPGSAGALVLLANGLLWAFAWRWLVTRRRGPAGSAPA
jgi:hypothetical protein